MAKFELYQQLNVRLEGRGYPIIIGRHALVEPSLWQQYSQNNQILIVSNETIAPLYLQQLKSAFGDRQCDAVILKDGEAYKNVESLMKIFDCLIEKQHHRDTLLIALGGGVIGDITGFAAATYQRGVQFLQVPTSLLAQVDAAVGGKTAINHPKAKNMIGSFYQPKAVVIDLETLQSLPPREFQAGLAEVIKYGLLEGGKFLTLIESALDENLQHASSNVLAEIISGCCQIKMKFVEEDEREKGQRALLNLGHTFGHALEAYSHYQRWLHGEAVAIGLYCAALLSYQLGYLDKMGLMQVDRLLARAKLPRRIPGDIDRVELRNFMSQDKKIKNKNLRFILMKAAGECYIADEVSEECLRQTLEAAIEGE